MKPIFKTWIKEVFELLIAITIVVLLSNLIYYVSK